MILIDDMGFASSEAYGGPCVMPNVDRLAAEGALFTRFHTTALCSSSRQALITGRNHHTAEMGALAEVASSQPGYTGMRPPTVAPISQMLNLNGYSTGHFGKCHTCPPWETSPSGLMTHWPAHEGFDTFYGFFGADTSQLTPALVDGVLPVDPPTSPEEGYHLTEDLVDQAMAAHTDEHVGRLLDQLVEWDLYDNTLILYILGDNGSSGEAGPYGTTSELAYQNDVILTTDQMIGDIDKIGTRATWSNLSGGWAQAMNAPYQWSKTVASHFGGTRNGLVMRWPGHITPGKRHQFTYLTDIAPTLLEAAGCPFPQTVNGAEQIPFEGEALQYLFTDTDAVEKHDTQYFEIGGNRAIYHRGWSAGTAHMFPIPIADPSPPLEEDVWELYAPEDWSQAHDLAPQQPGKLHELRSGSLSKGQVQGLAS
ncbi:MAG: sulfatase-like hydrolase/transferase [Nostocoides sp.]